MLYRFDASLGDLRVILFLGSGLALGFSHTHLPFSLLHYNLIHYSLVWGSLLLWVFGLVCV